MNGCEDLRPALGAYVLGALEPDEAAQVRRHIEDCPDCMAERDSLAPLPALLGAAGGAEAATTEPLSPAFEERLLDAYARDHAASPRHRLRWRLPRRRWLAAGAVGIAAVAAAVVGLQVAGDEQPDTGYDVTFQNVGAPATAVAKADLESDEEGTQLRLSIRGLPADEDAVYEVLCDAEAWTATAGTFRTDAEGHAYVVVTTALRRNEYNAIRIVRRGHRRDGSLYKRNVLTAKLS
jgi:anti-sigma-K factor RskA